VFQTRSGTFFEISFATCANARSDGVRSDHVNGSSSALFSVDLRNLRESEYPRVSPNPRKESDTRIYHALISCGFATRGGTRQGCLPGYADFSNVVLTGDWLGRGRRVRDGVVTPFAFARSRKRNSLNRRALGGSRASRDHTRVFFSLPSPRLSPRLLHAAFCCESACGPPRESPST
jgi:hypothetical protein